MQQVLDKRQAKQRASDWPDPPRGYYGYQDTPIPELHSETTDQGEVYEEAESGVAYMPITDTELPKR